MAYNLEDYETVKERKKKFYADHPEGRIIVELINKDSILEYALFRAMVYIDHKDEFPKAIGYALEVREKDLSVSNSGNQYASVNYTSWCENSEESAVGRALDNAGYAGNNKCSKEEMDKVKRAFKPGLDFIDVEAKLANLDTMNEIQEYRRELFAAWPKLSEKQIAALGKMFKSRESQVKEVNTEVENLL